MKPRLPLFIECMFPKEVVHLIYSFVPHYTCPKQVTMSPQLQRQLYKIQTTPLQGKHSMYMREFDDFILD